MGEWLILVMTNCLFVFAGWCLAQRKMQRQELCNLRQHATIVSLTETLTEIQNEMKKLLYCRFHGGIPFLSPPEPRSAFGQMIVYPTPAVRVLTANQIRRLASKFL